MLTNLIQNALQAVTPKNAPEICVSLVEQKSTVIIRISDNGTGIPIELKDKIFEPKFTTKNNGMGLGLGIVKNIIQSHGGRISFTSNLNEGTVFTIELKR